MVSEFRPSISRATSSLPAVSENASAPSPIVEEEGLEENDARRSARGAGRTGLASASGEARRAGAVGRPSATRPRGTSDEAHERSLDRKSVV